MFGSLLFTSTNGDSVSLHYLPLLEDLQQTSTYSWGAAVVAVLYRDLCRTSMSGARGMCGCAMLLQLWSWERLHLCCPEIVRHVVHGLDEPLPPLGAIWSEDRTFKNNPTTVVLFARVKLDSQGPHQVVWMPYTQERLPTAPQVCVEGFHIWASVVPLICYEIVERHFPDRVMRQFGLFQHIPEQVDTSATLHEMSRRGRSDVNWADEHAAWWYIAITRIFISPPTETPVIPRLEYEPHISRLHRVAHFAAERARIASAAMANAISDATSVIAHGWFTTCRDILDVLGEGHRLHQPVDPVKPARCARVRGGRARRRGRARSSQHSQYEVGSYSGAGPSSASAPSSTPTIWSPSTRRRTGR
ncbi:serine/threonine-protein phosphatase 7 long form homolog [Tripterygium wilfordii]|uniref:serine/threonine-protein phosphatase 7 long form homolog n=1 Tax=Tripterygium wilfordii TaxID=458696 RepID=UPI0018F80BA8|nr:serine/threonine-protein phosphatase 7 long form homolog [Tripterygium wilfordii]